MRLAAVEESAVPAPNEPAALLEVRDLTVHFPQRRGLFDRHAGVVRAVERLSFSLRRGETLGLVGESGCGKTTTGRAIMRLIEPTSGSVLLDGRDVASLGEHELRASRRRMQMIFQDPYSSLNPRHRIGDIVRAPLDIHGVGSPQSRRARVEDLLHRVGLRRDQANNFPHQFSGGQRQRIGIARALALDPALVICDEPVSALDVSVQAQILNLLKDLQRELGLSYLFISHDLGVVEHISQRIAVMYRGEIVETGESRAILGEPRHPYTQLLLASVPVRDPRQRRTATASETETPSVAIDGAGCPFAPRCPLASEICRVEAPQLLVRPDGRRLACHHR